MSNFRRRLMMSIKKEEKYTQLEYIEDTGTQHINTEVKTKQSLKIECIFSGNQVSTLLFGARKTASLDGLAWGFNNTDYAFSGFGGSTKKIILQSTQQMAKNIQLYFQMKYIQLMM